MVPRCPIRGATLAPAASSAGSRLLAGTPAANQRWTESFLEAGRRIAGMSKARALIAGGLSECWFVCPTILVRGWKFSG